MPEVSEVKSWPQVDEAVVGGGGAPNQRSSEQNSGIITCISDVYKLVGAGVVDATGDSSSISVSSKKSIRV